MSPGRRRRTGYLAPLLACVALVLGACASLPEGGAAQPFDVSVPDVGPVDLAAGGPTEGSTPEELISDFLLASAAGPTDDFATARLYLTQEAATTWKPDAGVEVYPTETTPGIVSAGGDGDADEVTLKVEAVASVDDDGVLTRTEDSSTISREFHLAKVGGEWRIASLDDGIVLSQASFTSAYRQVDLYFPATTGDALVADPRWYPAKRLTTHLLTGLVAGPQASLGSAVTTAVPEGTTIPSQGMDISDHVARVTLNATLPGDEEAQRLLAWQVVETLTQADTVTSVELTVSGTVVSTDDLPSSPAYRQDSAVGLSDGAVVSLTGSTLHEVLDAQDVGSDPSHPALDPTDGGIVAWTSDDSVQVRNTAGTVTATAAVHSPTWPSVDRFGWTWTLSSDTPGAAPVLLAADGTVTGLKAPFSDASTVAAMRVSPDGARVLILRVLGSTRSVWVAPVLRDSGGEPTGLGTATEVAGLSSGVLDVSWAGSSTLVALHSAGGTTGDAELVVVPIGGFVTTLGAPAEAATVSAGASADSVLVETPGGNVYARSGSVWQTVSAEVSQLHYPG